MDDDQPLKRAEGDFMILGAFQVQNARKRPCVLFARAEQASQDKDRHFQEQQ
jgi:hypothetical protein